MANVGSSQLSGFDCFQASSRMHQSTVHHALYLVVGGSIRCGCNPITPLLEVWSLASGGDGVSNNNLAPATPTKKPPQWAVWFDLVQLVVSVTTVQARIA
jgi:hypothetical protein